MTKQNKAKEVNKVEEKEVLTPSQYFDLLKEKKQEANKDEFKNLYDNACTLMKRYQITGQKSGALKLYKFAEVCKKEIEAIEAGITTYVTRFDLDEYISQIASKDVVLIELENFERDLPDDVIDKVAELKEKNIFDAYYVVFTDYSGGERKKVEQKRRDKDPILFGAMMIGEQINTRMYYIADWVDDYCDLTLDKMVKEFADKKKPSPVIDIKAEYPTLEDFKKSFEAYEDK